MDPIESINPKKDSTLAMMLAAQSRGWSDLLYAAIRSTYQSRRSAWALLRSLNVRNDLHDWFTGQAIHEGPLTELDAVLMRKDPPFDMEYIYTTYMLEMAEQAGLRVLNRPGSIRDC